MNLTSTVNTFGSLFVFYFSAVRAVQIGETSRCKKSASEIDDREDECENCD